MKERLLLRVYLSIFTCFILSGCVASNFYMEPDLYNYKIRTADYNLADLSTDTDIIIHEYHLRYGGNVNVSHNCDGTVVYMELDHGKSLGRIYCKQGWYPDETADSQQIAK